MAVNDAIPEREPASGVPVLPYEPAREEAATTIPEQESVGIDDPRPGDGSAVLMGVLLAVAMILLIILSPFILLAIAMSPLRAL